MSVAASSAHPISSGPAYAPTTAPAGSPGKVEVLALAIGTRITASALLIAAVVVLLVGAQALLGAMESMDRDIAEMNEQLTIANKGLETLSTTMDALPKTGRHVSTVLATVQGTSTEVKTSSARIAETATATTDIATKLGAINTSTAAMGVSHASAEKKTDQLGRTVTSLNTKLGPLAKQQHVQLQQTQRMSGGLDNMNDSLAYITRVLNYMSLPSTGGPFKIRADLTKETMPPIPGLKVEAEPISVFERGAFPIYTGR